VPRRRRGAGPDLVLGFLPPDENSRHPADPGATWPESLRFGCEADTQFADAAVTRTAASSSSGSSSRVTAPRSRSSAVPGTSRRRGGGGGARPRPGQAGGALSSPMVSLPARTCSAAWPPASPAPCPASPGARLPTRSADLGGGGSSNQDEVLPRPAWPSPSAASLCASRWCAAGPGEPGLHGDPGPPGPPSTRSTASRGRLVRSLLTVDGTWRRSRDAFRFPLILEGPAAERQGVYRHHAQLRRSEGGGDLLGSLHTGDRVRLGMGNQVSLVRTAARPLPRTPPDAAILYSCIGREAVLGTMRGTSSRPSRAPWAGPPSPASSPTARSAPATGGPRLLQPDRHPGPPARAAGDPGAAETVPEPRL